MRLASVAPSGSNEVVLYSAGVGTDVDVSSIVVCNRSASTATFRISISDGDSSVYPTQSKDYQCYDWSLPANASIGVVIGMSLRGPQEVRVYASSSDLSFTANGDTYPIDT